MTTPGMVEAVEVAPVGVVLAWETVAVKGAVDFAVPQEQQGWKPKAPVCQG